MALATWPVAALPHHGDSPTRTSEMATNAERLAAVVVRVTMIGDGSFPIGWMAASSDFTQLVISPNRGGATTFVASGSGVVSLSTAGNVQAFILATNPNPGSPIDFSNGIDMVDINISPTYQSTFVPTDSPKASSPIDILDEQNGVSEFQFWQKPRNFNAVVGWNNNEPASTDPQSNQLGDIYLVSSEQRFVAGQFPLGGLPAGIEGPYYFFFQPA
ncbi:hypothetical protein FRB99_006259 [Tulasnella sp. 403]|nr:hypothetical protein FRB99_006259 [Tulasnella sp. 403]